MNMSVNPSNSLNGQEYTPHTFFRERMCCRKHRAFFQHRQNAIPLRLDSNQEDT